MHHFLQQDSYLKPGYWVSIVCKENSHTVVEVLITVHMARMHPFMKRHNVLSYE